MNDVPLLARFLTRLATLLLLGAFRRRTATSGGRWGVPPPWRTPGTGVPGDAAQTAQAVRQRAIVLRHRIVEAARIVGHALTLAAFLCATAVLTTAGTTATSLGPRWLGIGVLVLAAVTLVVSLRELRVVWRLRVAQHRRRRAEELRRISA